MPVVLPESARCCLIFDKEVYFDVIVVRVDGVVNRVPDLIIFRIVAGKAVDKLDLRIEDGGVLRYNLYSSPTILIRRHPCWREGVSPIFTRCATTGCRQAH